MLFPEKPRTEIRVEQVRLLFQQGKMIQLLGICLALVTVGVFWHTAAHSLLLLWLLGVVLVLFARLVITKRFLAISDTLFDPGKWEKIYSAGTFASGVTWGTLALFYEPHWGIAYQVMLFIIFTGLVGASFNSNSSVRLAFPAFYIPLMTFFVYAMLRHFAEEQMVLALLLLVYVISMHISSLQLYNWLTQTLKVQFENEELSKRLTHSNERLLRLSEIDPLTQVFNRRSMDRFLSTEWQLHLEQGRELSVLFIDIDFFKQYNDTYGHSAGDRCLIAVARTLKQNIRNDRDMVARYGGEEFAVILPHTDCAMAQDIADRITQDIRQINMIHETSSVAETVTVSVGIATMVPDVGQPETTILETADTALYSAKRNGRDRTACAA
jgi:diguanylate cyclase (GGDEF)-like protein